MWIINYQTGDGHGLLVQHAHFFDDLETAFQFLVPREKGLKAIKFKWVGNKQAQLVRSTMIREANDGRQRKDLRVELHRN